MRYLLDSGVINDYAYRNANVHQRATAALRNGNRIGTGTPILGEILGGVLVSASRERNLLVLKRYLARFIFWNFDEAATRKYAELWASLRKAGRTIQVPDIQIAAIALTLRDCVIVSKDSDLHAIPGLMVENWFHE